MSTPAPQDRYRRLDLLGRGGMGEVFLAEDLLLRRKVAIKVVHRTALGDPRAEKLLRREAKAAAALDNPFICKVYEVGESDGRVFIAMEYIQGETLRQRMQKGVISLREAIGFAREIADGLDEASQKSIIHRDLKPSNIIITPQGRVKIMDFGLAKRLPGEPLGDESAGTPEGIVVGTREYMSPEQLRGNPLEPSSDLFAFGLILYEMLAGFHPFKKAAVIDTQFGILNDRAPDLSPRRPEVQDDLRSLIDGLLQKTPADRPRIGEVRNRLADLSDIARPRSKEATLSASRSVEGFVVRRPRLVLAAGGVLLLGLVALSAWTLLRKDPAPPKATMSSLVTWPSNEGNAALSPDGKHVSFISDRDGVKDVWMLDLPNGEPRRVTNGPGDLTGQTFSPDGTEIVYTFETSTQKLLQTVRADGGPPTRSLGLPPQTRVRRVIRWVGDDIFLATHESALLRLSLTSGKMAPIAVTALKPNDFDVSVDGMGGAIAARNGDGTRSIFVFPIGGQPKAVTGPGFVDGAPFQSGRSGKNRLFFESDRSGREDVWVMDRPGQEPRQVTFGSNREYLENVSVDGSVLAFTEVLEGASLYSFEVQTGRRIQLTAENTRDLTPTLAANGLLAFARVPLNSQAPWKLSGIQGAQLGGQGLSALRTLVRDGFSPLVSPNGRWLSYLSRENLNAPAHQHLLEMESGHASDLGAVDKGSLTYMDFPWSWPERSAGWSADGHFYFVQAENALDSRVVRIEPGKEPEIVARLDRGEKATHLTPAADGSRVFFMSSTPAGEQSVVEIHHGRRTRLLRLLGGDATILGFSRDSLVVAHQPHLGGQVFVKSLTGTAVKDIFSIPAQPSSWRLVPSLNGVTFSRRDARDVENIYLRSLETGKETMITNNGIQGVAFSPVADGGNGVLVFSQQLRNRDLGIIQISPVGG